MAERKDSNHEGKWKSERERRDAQTLKVLPTLYQAIHLFGNFIQCLMKFRILVFWASRVEREIGVGETIFVH